MAARTGLHTALLVAVAVAATTAAVVFARWGPFPIEVDGWRWHRVDTAAFESAGPTVFLYVLIGLVVVLAGRWVGRMSRRREAGVVALLVVLAFSAQLAAARQLPGGYNESIIALGKPGPNRYHKAARGVEHLGSLLRSYPEWMSDTSHQLIVTHPAGPVTLFWCLNHAFAGNPVGARRLVGWCEQHLAMGVGVREGQGAVSTLFASVSDPELAGVWLASFVLRAAAALVVLPVFAMARRVYGRLTGLWAAALAAAIPSLVLFSPGIDQCFPVLTATLCWLGWSAGESRSLWRAFAAGLVWSLGLFFSLSFVVAGAWAALLALAGLWRGAERPGIADAARLAAGALGGLLLPLAALHVGLGYNSLAVWQRCVANNATFNAASGRSYGTWVWVNPVEFLIFLGLPIACLFVPRAAGALRELKGRGVQGADWPTLIAAGLLMALNLTGLNRGEVSRLWMFFMPACAIAAAAEIERCAPYRRAVFAGLFALLVVQTACLKSMLDVLLGMYRSLGT